MKTRKIVPLLIALLITSIGFSQDLLLGMETEETVGVLGDPFGGMVAPILEAGTGTNTSRVLKIVGNTARGEVWQGINLNLTSAVSLTTTKTMTIDVLSATPITFLVKVNGGIAGAPEAAAEVTHNGNGLWQTLSFTFNTALDGKAVTANGVYQNFVIHTYWKAGETTFFPNVAKPERTFYVDNIKGVKAFLPSVAPTPTTPNAQVFSLFGDTGGFTNKWIPDYSFGGFLTKPDLDPTAGVNTAIKMDFSTQGYGEGLDPNVARKDVSAYGFLYFDYYVKSGNDNVGSLGHQFYIDLISRIGTTNTEGFYAIGSTVLTTWPASEQVAKAIVFDSWQTVSVPLSAFVGGFSPANFFQWKIGASSDLRTKVAFFDNIYFSNNPPPTPSPTASAQTFCGSATVSSLVATGTDLKWYTTPIGETALVSDVVLDPGTYYVSQTLNNLESDRTPVAVTVSPLPTTPTISVSGSTTLCQGESVILTSSSPSGNTWSNGATNQSISVTESGSYSVSVSNGNCSSTSAPVVLTVIPLPNNLTISSSVPTSICEGDSVTLSLNSVSAVRYLKFESYYSSDSDQVNVYEIQAFSNGVNVALNKPGYANSYNASGNWSTNGYRAVDGNFGSRWSSYRRDPGPDINNPHYIVVDLQSQFNLESVLLDINYFQQTFSFKVSQDGTNWIEIGSGNSVSGSFTFSPPTTNFSDLLWSNGETKQSITVSNSGSYSVKAFIGSTCSVTSNAIAVTVNPLPTTPTISVSGSTTLCQGESVVLTSSSPLGNTWSNGATTQSITVTQSGSYSVSVSNGNCSSTSSPVAVTVIPLPNNPIILSSGPTSFCEGGAVTLNLNNLSAVRYLKFESYYSSDSGQVNVNEIQAFSNGINVALNKPGYANSYEYGDWSSNGANAVDGDKWNRWSSNRNDPGPDVNNPHYIVVDLQSQFNLESVLLDINYFQQTFSFKVSQDGTNWIEIGSGNSVSGSFTYTPPIINYSGLLWSNGATTQSITVSNSGSYSVKAFIGSTCSVTSNAIAVTVNPLPTTPTISASGSTTFCQGESVVLTSSSPSGNTWSNGATTQSITVTESGSYSVSVSNDDCSATSNPVVVTVSPLPIILTISASGSTALCQGASIILTSSTPSGNTWSNGETTQSIIVSNSGFYSVTSSGVCANDTGNDTATVTVTELTVPSKPVTSAVTYCQYQTAIALTASEITTATTNWYDDPSAVTPYPNAPTPSTDTVGTFNYYVSQTADNGCESDRVLMEVTVYPIFDVSICYVSSDETETIRNRIFINNNGNYNVDKYQIFREGDASGIYDLIGEIPSNENSFLDLEADNSASSNKYKVKTKDISGLVSNDSSIHKTILLQSSLATNNNVNLSWTTYDGIGYGTYTIYRKVNDGVFEFLKSTSASNLSYTDVTANTSENKYSYYVSIAVNPCSTSLSTKWTNRNAAVTTQIRSNYKTILKQGGLGIKDNTIDLNIKVYPNPTSKLLYVSHPEQKNFSVRISDLTGKQMYSGAMTTATPLDIAKYPQGMYLVTVTSKETNQKNSYKILKK